MSPRMCARPGSGPGDCFEMAAAGFVWRQEGKLLCRCAAGRYADVLTDNRAALLRYLLMRADMLATSSRRLERFIYI